MFEIIAHILVLYLNWIMINAYTCTSSLKMALFLAWTQRVHFQMALLVQSVKFEITNIAFTHINYSCKAQFPVNFEA